MRLYSLVGADQHVDPAHGRFTPDKAGGFDFPDEISDVLGGFAVKGKRLWETEETRAERLHGMEMARRRDPASMLTAMEDNQALVRQLAELTAHLAAGQPGGTTAGADPAVARLTAQVEALTARLGEMVAPPASPADGEPEGPTASEGGPGPSKTARKPAAKTAKPEPTAGG